MAVLALNTVLKCSGNKAPLGHYACPLQRSLTLFPTLHVLRLNILHEGLCLRRFLDLGISAQLTIESKI